MFSVLLAATLSLSSAQAPVPTAHPNEFPGVTDTQWAQFRAKFAKVLQAAKHRGIEFTREEKLCLEASMLYGFLGKLRYHLRKLSVTEAAVERARVLSDDTNHCPPRVFHDVKVKAKSLSNDGVPVGLAKARAALVALTATGLTAAGAAAVGFLLKNLAWLWPLVFV